MKRNLGGLEVSPLGLGCMGMSFGYGKPKDEKEMINLIHKTYDLGISFFDTAEVYGPFTNEILVGKAVKNFRKDIVLASKFGIKIEGSSQTANSDLKGIRNSLENSLKRLQTDYLDIYYQHRVNPNVPVEDVAGLMGEFIKEGKIKGWGMSEASLNSIKKAHAVTPLTALQSEYSMWWREPEREILPFLEAQNIGFVPFSPLGKGFLAAKFDKNASFSDDDFRSKVPKFNKQNLEANFVLVEFLTEFAKSKGVSVAQVALTWLLSQKPFIVPIFGTTSESRLIENFNAINVVLSQSEMTQINKKLDEIKIVGERYSGDAAKMVGK